MIKIQYEDKDIIVVEKPVGMEAQSARGFQADMVSEIKKHINKVSTMSRDPYVGVIHRLDKPVGGIMVYAKTPEAANNLSRQLQEKKIKKKYLAVACGKLVDNKGVFVDFLLKNGKSNLSEIVDMGINGAKRAELEYRIKQTMEENGQLYHLVEINLLTGRHHQIRVQFAGHGVPLWGDQKYNPQVQKFSGNNRENVALFSSCLEFIHPKTGKNLCFSAKPSSGGFQLFQ